MNFQLKTLSLHFTNSLPFRCFEIKNINTTKTKRKLIIKRKFNMKKRAKTRKVNETRSTKRLSLEQYYFGTVNTK